jgi:hypothetical protein
VAPEPEGSSPHSQQPANGPYPEPGKSTPPPPPAIRPKVHFDPILPSTPWSSNWSLSLELSHQNPVHVSPLSHSILLDLICLIISGDEYKLWSYPLLLDPKKYELESDNLYIIMSFLGSVTKKNHPYTYVCVCSAWKIKSDPSRLIKKIVKMHFLEYTDIAKVCFTVRHIGRCCTFLRQVPPTCCSLFDILCKYHWTFSIPQFPSRVIGTHREWGAR